MMMLTVDIDDDSGTVSVQEDHGSARLRSQPGEAPGEQEAEERRHLRLQHDHLAGGDLSRTDPGKPPSYVT